MKKKGRKNKKAFFRKKDRINHITLNPGMKDYDRLKHIWGISGNEEKETQGKNECQSSEKES